MKDENHKERNAKERYMAELHVEKLLYHLIDWILLISLVIIAV